jgi:iron-sulfur cluster repair protein YtfE (RIC family)
MNKTSRDLAASSAAPCAVGVFDPKAFIEQRRAEHEQFLGGRLARLRELTCTAAEANARAADLADMDQKIACFCNDMPECCRREEQMVFGALLRLASQTHITACKAGMIAARLRFMVAEQRALLSLLDDAVKIVERNLSPAGPCESCHQLLAEANSFQAALVTHILREQQELFAWAIAREAELVCKI